MDLKDVYFHIQIAPHHRRFLRFALEGTAYQYPVLLLGLALAPAHFLEVHGRSSSHPLRASGMRVLNYLDDWLILAQSRDTPASHIDKLLRHLEFLRLCVNVRKSILAPSQSNVSGSVLRLKAVEMRARPPVCLPCAFSNWAVYYTCARCSFGWKLESLGRRGLRAVCASWSPAAASKLWGRAAKVSSAGGSPGLGDVTCRGHDWRIDWRPVSSVRGHADFRAVVRTSEPLAHKPLGAGSSVLSSKDFRPQLEQRHVLIRTDNMSVVSYINHQDAANLLLCADRHFLSIRAAHIPSLLNHRANMLLRKRIPQGEWRLHPESVRKIWTRYGAAEVDLFATSSRMHIACCSSPCLTPRCALMSHWPAARLYIYIYIYI